MPYSAREHRAEPSCAQACLAFESGHGMRVGSEVGLRVGSEPAQLARPAYAPSHTLTTGIHPLTHTATMRTGST